MTIRRLISRFPGIGYIRRSLGWQAAMFGDAMHGAGGGPADLTQPYARSAWVRSAIQFVAAPIAMRPLNFTADRRGGDVVIDDAALTAFWEKPGRSNGGVLKRADFMEATVGWLKLKGQCFWVMDDSWLDPRMGTKSRLFLARPDDMTAICNGRELVGWAWLNAKGSRALLIPEQVAHIKFWNPYHEILGLAEWEGAMIAAESDFAAGTFARNLAKNNGDRGPYVIGKSGNFSDEQIKQVSAQLRQKRELGRRGEFRAAFLPADVDIKEPAVNAVDAAYVAQRLENRKEVYAAFAVPQSFADAQASYSIGSASDRFRLIEDTCMPLGSKIEDAIELVSARLMPPGLTLFAEFDWDSHSTMQQVRAERFATATSAVDRGMPWHEASEYFRLKLPRFPGDAIGRVPFNLQEISNTPTDPTPPTSPTPPTAAPDPLAELEQLFTGKHPAQCPCSAPASAPQKAVSARSQAIWTRIRKLREPWEKKFEQKISRYLMDARAETLRNIAASAKKTPVTKEADALSLIFDLAEWLRTWCQGLTQVSRAAMEAAGIEVWTQELGKDDPMTQPSGDVLLALHARQNMLSGAGTKVWEAVRDELAAGIRAGDTTEQLAERTRRKFAGIDKQRATVIAKTETTVAYETARDMAFRAAGVQWKQWLASGLGNSRLTHLGANEQIVAVGEKFVVGGFPLAYPGDPDGPPKEIINCNCVTIAVSGPDGNDIEGNDNTEIPY